MPSLLRIPEFRSRTGDPDALVVIRWIDRPAPNLGTKAGPNVAVELGTLPVHITVQDLAKRSAKGIFKAVPEGGLQVERIDAGLMCCLHVGMVFRHGIHVTDIALEAETFTFDRESTDVFIRGAMADGVAPKPKWWKDRYPYRVLPPSTHRRSKLASDANFLVFRDRLTGQTVQIPCAEVFASWYAPHSRIARALLGGLWDGKGGADQLYEPERAIFHAVDRLVNRHPDRTRSVGEYPSIGIRHGLPLVAGPYLYMLAMTEVGHREACSIYRRHYTSAKKATSEQDTYAEALFEAYLPFEWSGQLEICLEGYRPYEDGGPFVGLRVLETPWPFDISELQVWSDGDAGKGKRQELTDDLRPFADYFVPRAAAGSHVVDLPLYEAPSTGMLPLIQVVRSFGWLDPPRLRRPDKDFSRLYPNVKSYKTRDVSEGGSGVQEGTGGPPPIETERHDPIADHVLFPAIMRMLEAAAGKGKVHVVPPVEDHGSREGGHPVWTILTKGEEENDDALDTRWGFMDPSSVDELTMKPRLRTVFVARTGGVGVIAVARRSKNGKATEGYQSLTFAPDGSFSDTTLRLLELCLQEKGVWPERDWPDWSNYGVRAGAKWKHHWLKVKGIKTNELNPKPFINSLSRV